MNCPRCESGEVDQTKYYVFCNNCGYTWDSLQEQAYCEDEHER